MLDINGNPIRIELSWLFVIYMDLNPAHCSLGTIFQKTWEINLGFKSSLANPDLWYNASTSTDVFE